MNIFDSVFNGMGRSELYRSQAAPDVFPHEKPMMLQNWSQDDLEMYVGGEYLKPAQNLDGDLVND